MEYLIGIYLAYIVAVGVFFFSIKYLIIERKIVDWSEFLLLSFFPIIGFGTWMYKREKREKGNTTFSKKWYIWKYMVPINIWFICLLTVAFLIIAFLVLSTNPSGGSSSGYSVFSGVFEIFGDFFSGLFTFLFLIIMFGILLVYALILILIPKFQVQSIENKYHNKQKEKQIE
nr:hypothetical protein [uncultured Psychroserpens sp.]